jgi:hypothetical protein
MLTHKPTALPEVPSLLYYTAPFSSTAGSHHWCLWCLQALCPEAPFLPASKDNHPTLSAQPEAALLDRQFRLLREDMVGPRREELHNLGITGPPSKPAATDAAGAASASSQASSSTQAAGHAVAASAEGITAAGSRNVFRQPAVLGTCLKPKPCIMFSIQLPPGHKANRLKTQAERVEFWSNFGHSTLQMDALVCLVTPGRPLLFGTVARRDPVELAHEQPIIGLSFDQEQDAQKVLAHMACGPLPHGTVLVQVRRHTLFLGCTANVCIYPAELTCRRQRLCEHCLQLMCTAHTIHIVDGCGRWLLSLVGLRP